MQGVVLPILSVLYCLDKELPGTQGLLYNLSPSGQGCIQIQLPIEPVIPSHQQQKPVPFSKQGRPYIPSRTPGAEQLAFPHYPC